MSVASHENNRKPIFSGFFLNIIKEIVFKFIGIITFSLAMILKIPPLDLLQIKISITY